jgi:hypothetical protein
VLSDAHLQMGQQAGHKPNSAPWPLPLTIDTNRSTSQSHTASHLQEISELDRQLNDLNSHLADLAGLRELQGSMAATKAAEVQAQAQHDSQAEQVGSCWLWGFAAMGSKLLLCNKGGRAAGAARQPGRAGGALLQLYASRLLALGLVRVCLCWPRQKRQRSRRGRSTTARQSRLGAVCFGDSLPGVNTALASFGAGWPVLVRVTEPLGEQALAHHNSQAEQLLVFCSCMFRDFRPWIWCVCLCWPQQRRQRSRRRRSTTARQSRWGAVGFGDLPPWVRNFCCATKGAEQQAQHDSQAEQVGRCCSCMLRDFWPWVWCVFVCAGRNKGGS